MLKIYDALKAVLFTAFGTFTFICYTFFMLALSRQPPVRKALHLVLHFLPLSEREFTPAFPRHAVLLS